MHLASLLSAATSLDHPVAALVTLFGLGVLTSANPCMWPMIPITAGIISGGGGTQPAPRGRVIGRTLVYVTGLALVYATVGLVAGLTGTLFGTVASNLWVRLVVANLFVLAALAMLDVFPVNAPRRLTAWASGLSGGSYPAVFLMGATSGIVAAPCGTAPFVAVLTWVGATRSGTLGFLYLFVYSLGMTAVLVGVGLVSGLVTVLPKPGPWMAWIKRVAAVVLLLVAEYYLVEAGKTL